MPHEGRRTAAGAAASLTALLLAAPSPAAAVTELADAASSSDATGPLVAVVGLAAWATTGWLVLAVAVVLLSRLPGLAGRAGAVAARCVAPVAVRRTVETALGLTVAVGVLAPTAALATAQAGPAGRPTAEATWDLDWPSRATPPPAITPPAGATSSPSTSPSTSPAAAPAAAPVPTTSAASPSETPRARATAPSRVLPTPARPAPAGPSAADTVVVRTGDTLWSLAESSLRTAGAADPSDRQVAQAWPQWWAANRAVIGDDPDLLLPGTVLRPPAGAP